MKRKFLLVGFIGPLATAVLSILDTMPTKSPIIKRDHQDGEDIIATLIDKINQFDKSANLKGNIDLLNYINDNYLDEAKGDKLLNAQKVSQFKHSSGDLNTISKAIIYLLADLLNEHT